MTITTNNHWREFLYCSELTDEELLQFDYQVQPYDNRAMSLRKAFELDEDAPIDGYLRYRGCAYHLDQFMRVGYPGPFGQTDEDGYHGHHDDSFFSGVLIRLSENGERYQIATYIS